MKCISQSDYLCNKCIAERHMFENPCILKKIALSEKDNLDPQKGTGAGEQQDQKSGLV